MDIYYPEGLTGLIGSVHNANVVLFIHGGAYMMGDKDSYYMDEVQKALEDGYVAVNINYRLIQPMSVLSQLLEQLEEILQDPMLIADILQLISDTLQDPEIFSEIESQINGIPLDEGNIVEQMISIVQDTLDDSEAAEKILQNILTMLQDIEEISGLLDNATLHDFLQGEVNIFDMLNDVHSVLCKLFGACEYLAGSAWRRTDCASEQRDGAKQRRRAAGQSVCHGSRRRRTGAAGAHVPDEHPGMAVRWLEPVVRRQ